MTKRRKELAVIGGGAKAAAIAAKAAALREAELADIGVTIFEPHEIGAAWSGRRGYTDGEQQLCTPIERDLGFPYTSNWGAEIDSALFQRYSWQSFLFSKTASYREWVDDGRLTPAHSDFADYLKWAIKRSDAHVVQARVGRLEVAGKRWLIKHKAANGRFVASSDIAFDGVVLTGAGPARSLKGIRRSPNVFNGYDFWHRAKEVRRALRSTTIDVVIVGAGGTAAATLSWLVKNGYAKRSVTVVAEQASFFTRGDSLFENKLFSDDEEWASLSTDSRKEFVNRLNRGVVWASVMNEVRKAERLQFIHGRADSVKFPRHGGIELSVTRGDNEPVTISADVLVDASGFDPWWFVSLFDPGSLPNPPDKERRAALEAKMTDSLRLSPRMWKYPPFHVPPLSSAIGPGFASLMTLGSMADRVLSDYA